MNIRIQKNSVNFQELTNYLMEHFPKYNFYQVDNSTIKITTGKISACYVKLGKNKIVIKGAFAKSSYYALFVLFTILLGVIGPLLAAYLVLFPRIKKLKQSVADAIYTHYKQTVLNYSNFGRNLDEEKKKESKEGAGGVLL